MLSHLRTNSDLFALGNRGLQAAVRGNLVSFPAQVPTYERQARPDIQWRLAVLYFVQGWSQTAAGRRYGISGPRVGQILKAWRMTSLKSGYIEERLFITSPAAAPLAATEAPTCPH
jgi:hypothetical protein